MPAPIDKTTFKDCQVNFQSATVQIYFEENLMLNEYYEISINKGIKNTDGLNLQYSNLIYLHINGENSQFLEFYVDDFSFIYIGYTGTNDYSNSRQCLPVLFDFILMILESILILISSGVLSPRWRPMGA